MATPPAFGPDPGIELLGLYDVALPQVYGYLLPRCGNRALAEDLTADPSSRRSPPDESRRRRRRASRG